MANNTGMHLERWVDELLATLDPDNEWRPNAVQGLSRLRERGNTGSRRRQVWTWAAAAAAVACLAAMALPATRVLAQRCVGACSEAGIRLWQSLSNSASVPVAGNAEANLNMAPDFTLSDASGKPVKLSDFRGKVVLLNFWATWCPPCKVEIPWFVEFQKTYGHRDFVVLGVSLDEDGWTTVKPYMDENHINYRMMIGNSDIAALYGGLDSLPVTLIIDKSGRIVSTHVGLVSKSGYNAEIEPLLSK